MKSILIPIMLVIFIFGGFCYASYEKRHAPRIGQVWIRNIETATWHPNHVDTILILNIDCEHDEVIFTKLDKYDEWTCSMYTVKHYGTLLK